MSARSYPDGFKRPPRESPVLDEQEHQAMLARLKRRCDDVDAKRNPINGSSGGKPESDQPAGPHGAYCSKAPGAVPSPTAAANASVAQQQEQLDSKELGRSEVQFLPEAHCNGPDSGYAAEPVTPTALAPSVPALRSNGSGVAQPVAEHGVDQPGLPGADQAAVAILEWERVGPYAMRTLCGTWTCCKVTVGGHTHYELWRRIAGLERPARALWDFLTFESAKEAAQEEMDRCE